MRQSILIPTIILFIFSVSAVKAQRMITGKVLHAETGKPVLGAAIIAEGTTARTVTDRHGQYKIDVKGSTRKLIFVAVGMKKQEVVIGDRTEINVELEPKQLSLTAGVETIFGIQREKKALGYAATNIGSDQFTGHPTHNFLTVLQGKIPGADISTSTGNFAGSVNMLLRGVHSFYGNNQPLLIIDGIVFDNSCYTTPGQAIGAGGFDYGNLAADIELLDIKNINIIRGSVATAIYGLRAASGAIVLQTQNGDLSKPEDNIDAPVFRENSKKETAVSYNFEFAMEQPALFPEFQNQYGGGRYPQFGELNLNGDTYKAASFASDQSWGPAFKGQQVVQWFNVYDYEYGITPALQTSVWGANPDNVKEIFENGMLFKHNVAVSGGDYEKNFRLSYTNTNRNGIYPNSQLKRNSLFMNTNYRLAKRINASATINYMQYEASGLPQTGYKSLMAGFLNGQRQLATPQLRNYTNPNGTQRTWNRTGITDDTPLYYNNPYWQLNKNYPENTRTRYTGRANVAIKLFRPLELAATVCSDYYLDKRNERIAISSVETSKYSEANREKSETTALILLKYRGRIYDKLQTQSFIGTEYINGLYNLHQAHTQGGLVIPNFYSLSNSGDAVQFFDSRIHNRIHGMFANVFLNYDHFVYLDLVVRHDKTTMLPDNANTALSFASSASFVVSELISRRKYPWLTYGKARAAWALTAHQPGSFMQNNFTAGYGYSNVPAFSLNDVLYASNIQAEKRMSLEGGFEALLFRSRLGVDFTYYRNTSSNLLTSSLITPSTGYTSKFVSEAQILNSGFEVALSGNPLEFRKLRWDVQVNWTKNFNTIKQLADSASYFALDTLNNTIGLIAKNGESFGTLIGKTYIKDEFGNRVVGADGSYLSTDKLQEIANTAPKWYGSITNNISYRGIRFSFQFDVYRGGKFFSATQMCGMAKGTLIETVENEFRNIGRTLPGKQGSIEYDINGNKQVVTTGDNNVMIDGYNYANMFQNGPSGELNLIDAHYIKLREIRLTYSIPDLLMKKIKSLSEIHVSATARNVYIFGSKLKHIDPEFTYSTGIIQGIEAIQNPGTRMFGFNLNVVF